MKGQDNEREGMVIIMGAIPIFTFLIVGLCLMMSSCCPKIYGNAEHSQVDSVRVEIRDRIIHDTLRVEIPQIVEKVVVPQADTSSLENKYSRSVAFIDTLGFLHHSLETIPQEIEAVGTMHVTDTTTTHYTETHEKETIVKEVEREFTWWEKVRLRAFWWLCGAIVTLIAAFALRNRIVKLIK